MFTYYHCYMPQTWEAQERCGLIDEHAGVRFMEVVTMQEERKFNRLAAEGTPFYRLMRERRFPMYIDRLQGGIYLENYDYDWSLVNRYRDMLGERFIGFQMHEWMSNFANDFKRIHECLGDRPWTAQAITDSIFEKYSLPYLWLEAQSAAEMEQSGDPKTAEEFLRLSEELFQKRMALCGGQLIPCDSFSLAYQLELRNGARYFMPEVGAQTVDTRVQIAYARGMARTHGKCFGMYYEPWGGEPFSSCNFHREGDNEWNIKNDGDWAFSTMGENGGSSRSLQKRAHLYSYFAGADFISEEWGMSNTFYDWQDFELTPYGKIKLDFLQLVKKYPRERIGTPYTPLAVVLPKDLPTVAGLEEEPTLLGYPMSGERARQVNTVRRGLRALLANPAPMVGCETENIINSDIPDAIDVIHEDYPTLPTQYDYFVDLTGTPAFAKSHRCCSVEEAPALLKELLPCEVEGGVQWFVNRTPSGWLLVMFNNSGVHRSVEKGEYILPEGAATVTVRLKNARELQVLEGTTALARDGETYHFTLSGGDWWLAAFDA